MKLGIEKKIMLPFLLLVIIPVLSVGIVSYLGSFNHLLENEKKLAVEELNNAAFALDNLYQMSRDKNLSSGELHLKTIEFLDEKNMVGFFINKGKFAGAHVDADLQREFPNLVKRISVLNEGEIPLAAGDFAKRFLVFKLIPGQNLLLFKTVQMDYLAPPLLEIQKYTILVALAGVIFAVELTILIAHSLSRPIRRLAEVCHEIGKGNLKPQLEIQRNDEIGILADSIRDMSQSLYKKRKIEERIETINRLTSLGELAAGLAHEIRNPLAGMKTSCQVLGARLKDQQQHLHLLEGVQAEINRLNNLVTDLLGFARTTPTRITAVDIQEIILNTRFLLDKQLTGNNIVFLVHAPTNLPPVKADKDHLQQIFLNLFLNALKFMPAGGTLEVSIKPRRESKNLYIMVSDTGTGIDPEHLPKIFNPFFSTDPQGTGLGLAVVQKLVAENEGAIDVNSEPGRTTFTIQLPVMERG